MLHKLVAWALGEEANEARDEKWWEERRSDRRHDFTGTTLKIRDRRVNSLFHAKDMSLHGACGISDMPLAVGAIIFVQIGKGRYRAARICWVRNALIGIRFFRPLDPVMLDKLRRNTPSGSQR